MTDPLHPNKSFETAVENFGSVDHLSDVYAATIKTPLRGKSGVFALSGPLIRRIMDVFVKFAESDTPE
jgi:hypothetical protein